jgi:hypothetical protein
VLLSWNGLKPTLTQACTNHVRGVGTSADNRTPGSSAAGTSKRPLPPRIGGRSAVQRAHPPQFQSLGGSSAGRDAASMLLALPGGPPAACCKRQNPASGRSPVARACTSSGVPPPLRCCYWPRLKVPTSAPIARRTPARRARSGLRGLSRQRSPSIAVPRFGSHQMSDDLAGAQLRGTNLPAAHASGLRRVEARIAANGIKFAVGLEGRDLDEQSAVGCFSAQPQLNAVRRFVVGTRSLFGAGPGSNFDFATLSVQIPTTASANSVPALSSK